MHNRTHHHNRVLRDIRASRGAWHMPVVPRGPGKAARFAAALLERYGLRLWGAPGVDRAFRLRMPGVTIQQMWYTTRVHLEPRLALTLLTWQGHSSEIPAVRLARCEEPQLASRARIAGWEPRHAKQMVQRSFARIEHIETSTETLFRLGTATQPADTPAPILMQPSAPPVPRIFHHALKPPFIAGSPALPEASKFNGPDSPGGESSKTLTFQPTAPGRASEQLDLKPGEINRLTDRVIEAIDRRITAQRERLGRT